LRNGITDVAVVLVAEKGVEALSVAEVCPRAAVSGSAPYRHFPSRDLLLAATAAQIGRQLADDMQVASTRAIEQADADHVGVEALAAAMVVYARFVAQRRVGLDFIFSRELADLRYSDLTATARGVMDVLLPLAMQVVDEPAAALRLLEQQISVHTAWARSTGAALRRTVRPAFDALAVDAERMARVLAAVSTGSTVGG
jgi:AcrR family transcriptional regulator